MRPIKTVYNAPSDNENTIAEEHHKNRLRGTGILIPKAVLLIVSENFFGKSYILKNEEAVIGRDKDCNITIDDPHISGRHCKISFSQDGHHYLEDLESTNGTFLNKKIIKKRVLLYYSDRIVIGDTIIRFYLEEKLQD